METSELRLGNWIELRYDSAPVRYIEVNGINVGSVYNKTTLVPSVNPSINTMRDLYSRYLYPIRLTDEIIQKCGFEIRNNGEKTYYNPLMELDHDFNLMNYESNIRIRFVHQLQNLYFALTNQELEVNLIS